MLSIRTHDDDGWSATRLLLLSLLGYAGCDTWPALAHLCAIESWFGLLLLLGWYGIR
jgi:hypothetical protein